MIRYNIFNLVTHTDCNMISENKLFFILFVLSSAAGFMFDDPCDVFPSYPGGIPRNDNFTTTVNVPKNCRNGTFRWDYPKGHTLLEFKNTDMEQLTICARDALGGDIFTISNTASRQYLGELDNTWSCFAPTSARDIELQVDAPEMQMYMGEFEYKITQS